MTSDALPQTPQIDVTTTAQAFDLAGEILSRRAMPLVLVSTNVEGQLEFDVDLLRTELDGVAKVVTIRNGRPTYTLGDTMPDNTHVYGGAARSYPPLFALSPVQENSPIRFPQFSTVQDLVDDAQSQVGSRRVDSIPQANVLTTTGVVKSFYTDGSGALVQLDSGEMVTVSATSAGSTAPIQRALRLGDRIAGTYVADSRTFIPTPSADVANDYFPNGCVTLALVTKVTDMRITAELLPGESIVLRRRNVTDDQDISLTEFADVGDVKRMRVEYNNGALGLSMRDVDDDAPLHPPAALFEGASPWLREGENLQESDAAPADQTPTISTPVAPVMPIPSAAAPSRELGELRTEITELRRDVLALTNLIARLGGTGTPDAVTDELTLLRHAKSDLEAQLRTERAERAAAEAKIASQNETIRAQGSALRSARKSNASFSPTSLAHASDPEAWFRAQVSLAWEERSQGTDRVNWPLREYTLGVNFIDSLRDLSDDKLAKAVRASVDAITGRDREIPARELHRLREGTGGNDPYVTRADGAACWRSAVEVNSPSARRLHYWQLSSGAVELSRVVLHDDMMP